MPKDLSHLSDNEIETLIQRYYAGEPVTKLLTEYHLSVRSTTLYKLFPPEVCKEEICEYCNEYLVRERSSKTASAWRHDKSDMYCPICSHRPYARSCKCDNCIEKERIIAEQKRQQIKDEYSRKRTPVDFSTLSFEQKVFSGALCRALCEENLYEIKAYIGSNTVLAPTDDLCSQMYKTLANNGIIAVSPASPLEAFVVDEDFPNKYYIYKVTYYLNLVFPPNKQTLFDEMLNPTYYSPEHENEALRLWRQIAVGECLEYLVYQLQQIKFEFTPGEKTYKTFDILLNDFSVSQIYNIIWQSVKSVSKLYLEGNISKKHAANTVIGACERYAERVKMSGWKLIEYNRIKELPQSELSAFFFNRVLRIGDIGFKTPPSKEGLQKE